MAERHEAGVEWHRHPIPARGHRCFAASTYDSVHGIMQRCPCGAARFLNIHDFKGYTPPWVGRNTRRTDPVNRKPYRRPVWLKIWKKVLP